MYIHTEHSTVTHTENTFPFLKMDLNPFERCPPPPSPSPSPPPPPVGSAILGSVEMDEAVEEEAGVAVGLAVGAVGLPTRSGDDLFFTGVETVTV